MTETDRPLDQTPDQASSRPSAYDLAELDQEFKTLVAGRPGGDKYARCYACGACSARCPVMEFVPDFDPRRLLRLVALGRREILASPLIWLCSTCFTCVETCPQEVGFAEVMFVLRNLAREAGLAPPALGAQTTLLVRHGRLYEITDFENQRRAELGLPPLTERPDHYRTILQGAESAQPGSDKEGR